ncbi:unnamed protein product [Pseudo-nitzschia multistriata]|uniref:Uncharacterized protein n=1 Tax=Pseudo-nitzschia multistriata TaxID=183589 RepID=A0A448YZJ3_9STRA|nr:unnamed protein product [Pseudo-nitzschia multistriata]
MASSIRGFRCLVKEISLVFSACWFSSPEVSVVSPEDTRPDENQPRQAWSVISCRRMRSSSVSLNEHPTPNCVKFAATPSPRAFIMLFDNSSYLSHVLCNS